MGLRFQWVLPLPPTNQTATPPTKVCNTRAQGRVCVKITSISRDEIRHVMSVFTQRATAGPVHPVLLSFYSQRCVLNESWLVQLSLLEKIKSTMRMKKRKMIFSKRADFCCLSHTKYFAGRTCSGPRTRILYGSHSVEISSSRPEQRRKQ